MVEVALAYKSIRKSLNIVQIYTQYRIGLQLCYIHCFMKNKDTVRALIIIYSIWILSINYLNIAIRRFTSKIANMMT